MIDALIEWIMSLPYYLLNAWNFWLTIIVLILFSLSLVYHRRRYNHLQLIIYSLLPYAAESKKQDEPNRKPKLKMEEFSHV